MKIIKLSFLYLFLIFNAQFSIASENKSIENFVIYTIRGERCLFFDIIASIPDKGFLIINFTSINCRPCRKEIPELRELIARYKDNTRLIYIYSEAGKPVQELSSSLGVLDCTFVDPFGNAQKLFAVKSVPVTFLIDKKSNIICRLNGYTHDNMEFIEAMIKEKK